MTTIVEDQTMPRSRMATLPALLAIFALILAACGSSTESSPAGDGGGATDGGASGGDTVSMTGNEFSPSTLTVAAGTTVTFTDTASHTVTEGTDGVAVDDPIVDETGGSDITVTFDEPGTYNITCKVHPEMNMTITVEG
jgi:plastocyanin